MTHMLGDVDPLGTPADADEPAGSVILPHDAAASLRRALLGRETGDLRIAFVAGPGDVGGTFARWLAGEHDARTPVIAYSTMLFALVERVGARTLIISETPAPPGDALIRFVRTPRRRDRSGVAHHLDELAFAISVAKQVRAFRPHVVLVGTDAPPYLYFLLPRRARIVLTAHNTFWPLDRKPKRDLRTRLVARALRRVDGAVCTSSGVAAQVAGLRKTARASAVEIPQILRSRVPTLRARTHVRNLAFIGRIEIEKGVMDAVTAFEAIAGTHPELRLHLAGVGSQTSALAERVARSPRAARITFHRLLNAAAVHELLEATDLLVCPTRSSFNEGLALVAVEAAAHGIPSVVSSVVPAKILLEGACLEYPADDVDALQAALARVLDDPELYGALHAAAVRSRTRFFDRSVSWGSQLYRVLAEIGRRG